MINYEVRRPTGAQYNRLPDSNHSSTNNSNGSKSTTQAGKESGITSGGSCSFINGSCSSSSSSCSSVNQLHHQQNNHHQENNDIFLQCSQCYRSLYFPMYERTVIKTTDKRRLNRFCGFLAVFLSLFLLFSSLLEAEIDNEALVQGTHYWTQPFKIKRLPQCIIIGARKCGTRALIDMLNLHPQVCHNHHDELSSIIHVHGRLEYARRVVQ